MKEKEQEWINQAPYLFLQLRYACLSPAVVKEPSSCTNVEKVT
jgi:hypothetical protein